MDEAELRALPAAELDQLWVAVRAEVSRRVTIDNAPDRIREISQQVTEALGIHDGDAWDPKMRTRGGYRTGQKVTHEGDLFESLIDNNVFEPGAAGGPQSYRWWKNLSDVPAEGVWNPNGHNYKKDDEFTYNGVRYRVRSAHKSQPDWTPDVVLSLYLPI